MKRLIFTELCLSLSMLVCADVKESFVRKHLVLDLLDNECAGLSLANIKDTAMYAEMGQC